MITRCFALVFVSVAASFALGSTATPLQDAPLFPTRNNFFTIPFEIKVDHTGELPTEVELTYSNDRMNWFSYGRVHPEKKQFLFNAPTDGEYWFIFKTYGQDGLVKETRRRGPMLRVLVDTIPPKLTLAAEQRSTGEIAIQWSVEDANLARKTPQLQVSYSIPDQRNHYPSHWKPVAIDPLKIQSDGNKHQGELLIWPERNAVSFEIQAEIVDMAGNREMQSRTVALNTITQEEDSNLLTESMQSGFQQPNGQRPNAQQPNRRPSPRSGVDAVRQLPTVPAAAESMASLAPKASTSLQPPRPVILQPGTTRPLQSPQAVRSQIADLSEINHSLKSANSPQSAREGGLNFGGLTETGLPVASAPTNDSVLIGPLLFTDDIADGDSLFVGSPQPPIAGEFSDSSTNREVFSFSLEEPSREWVVDLSGDSSGDLLEDGPKLFTPNPKYAPPPDLFEEPALTSYNELEDEPTNEDGEPDFQAEIAAKILENPNAFIRITKVSHLHERFLKLNQVQVTWETDENSWTGSENVKVHIFRGRSQNGPWTPIALARENVGSYAWDISEEDRNPFYVLLQCEEEMGENSKNLVSDLTMQPIQLSAALFK